MNVTINAKGNSIVVESGATYVEHATQNNYYAPQQPLQAEAEETGDKEHSPNKPGTKQARLLKETIDEEKVAVAVKDFLASSFDKDSHLFIIGSDGGKYKVADTLASLLFALEGLELCNSPLSATALLRFLKDNCGLDFDDQKNNLNNRIAKVKALTEPNYKPFCRLTSADFPPHPKDGALRKDEFTNLQFITNRILDSLEGKNFKKES